MVAVDLVERYRIVPTGVGVNRGLSRPAGIKPHCPHGRGGEPPTELDFDGYAQLSPRAWG